MSLDLEQRATIANAAKRTADKLEAFARSPQCFPDDYRGLVHIISGWRIFADEIMATATSLVPEQPRHDL